MFVLAKTMVKEGREFWWRNGCREWIQERIKRRWNGIQENAWIYGIYVPWKKIFSSSTFVLVICVVKISRMIFMCSEIVTTPCPSVLVGDLGFLYQIKKHGYTIIYHCLGLLLVLIETLHFCSLFNHYGFGEIKMFTARIPQNQMMVPFRFEGRWLVYGKIRTPV